MQDEYQDVRIGSKSENKYVSTSLFCLKRSDTIYIEGLGRWSDKVLDVADKLTEITNVDTGSPQVIDVDGVSGLRIKIEKKEGGPP